MNTTQGDPQQADTQRTLYIIGLLSERDFFKSENKYFEHLAVSCLFMSIKLLWYLDPSWYFRKHKYVVAVGNGIK